MIFYLDSLQPWGALLLRLTLGSAMLYAGWDKVVPAGGLHGNHALSALHHWIGYVVHLGFPAWLGVLSAITEFFGGALLILGLLTRLFSFLIAVNLSVAIWKVTSLHGYHPSQYPIALLTVAIMLLFCGAGALSLDRRIGLE